ERRLHDDEAIPTLTGGQRYHEGGERRDEVTAPIAEGDLRRVAERHLGGYPDDAGQHPLQTGEHPLVDPLEDRASVAPDPAAPTEVIGAHLRRPLGHERHPTGRCTGGGTPSPTPPSGTVRPAPAARCAAGPGSPAQ